MNTFKLEEKLELTHELGLDNLTSFFEDTKKSLNIKLKKTTYDEIKQKLISNAKKSKGYKLILNKFKSKFITLFIGLSILPLISIWVTSLKNGFESCDLFVSIAILSLTLFYAFSLSSRYDSPFIDVDEKPLNKWDDDIPYGALLAVKEAKESGLKEFLVYYPSQLKKEDPILVAKDSF